VRHVGIGEDAHVDTELVDLTLEHAFIEDRDSFGIQIAGQSGRIDTIGDVGNLRSGETHDFVRRLASKYGVEVVEVAASSPDDDRPDSLHSALLGAGSEKN